MMKRLLLGVLILSLAAFALLAGCQKRSSASAVQTTTGSQGKQDPFGKYDPVITMSTARTMSSGVQFDETDPDKRSYEENRWVRTYREDLGIQLAYTWLAPDGESNTARWNAAIASQIVPDFANVSDNIYKLLYDADLVADMTDIWENYVTDEYVKSLGPNDIEMMTIDGRMYGFPGGTRSMAGTTLLFLRQDWMDKLGLKDPESIDEVVEIARKFKDAKLGGPDTIPFFLSNNVSGGSTFSGGDGKWDGFMNAYGGYLNYWIEKDGKLAFSSVQPEIRPALLKLQELYKEGLINRDFATVNTALSNEYVGSGKVGINYGSAWSVVSAMNTLVSGTPEFRTTPWKMITSVFPPPAVRGQAVKAQTNSPKGMRVFVSKKTPHPEAALKIATLAYNYENKSKESYQYYIEGDHEDFGYYRYLPWGDHMTSTDYDLYRAEAVRLADMGDLSVVEARNWTGSWEEYQAALRGENQPYQLMMNGPYGSFCLVYDYYNKGQIMMQGFNGLPTDTMALKGDLLRGSLETAMFEVVMGADISVWDQAAQKWYTDGGTQITDEVNKWYDGVKKN
jgi:putative aldouronate transport system substrate-binding protein